MGCKNSKTVRVAPAEVESSVHKRSSSLKQASKSLESLDGAEADSRGASATSKTTKHSNDSGFGKDEPDDGEIDEYGNIITEDSDERLRADIEKQFQPVEELDLCLTGIAAPRNWSAKDKARMDEQRILESLRNEGFIATAKFECRSGLAFEVIEENHNIKRALPARLVKLERKKKKKKKLTQEDINKKLELAEQRRKEAEAERLEKIHNVTAKSDITNAKESFAHQTQEIKEQVQVKVDTATENREKRLQQLREKLRAREEHAAKVRLRKKLHIPTEEEINAAKETDMAQQSD